MPVMFLFLTGCSNDIPDSILLFIGSGMGTGHVSADYFFNDDSPFSEFDEIALIDTRPRGDRWITDAAAAASAIATGVKVEQGTLSQDTDGDPFPTILEIAQKHKKSTGIISTTSLTSAVPAAFMVHMNKWGREYQIAQKISESNVDVLLGGGLRFFKSEDDSSSSLIADMEAQGYTIITQQNQLDLINPQKHDKLLGLFASEALRQATHRSLSLKMMTEKALGILSKNPKGFLLVVEGSQIDWRAHEKDDVGLLAEIQDFTDAINYGLIFRKDHPKLLLVVTGTNETGGVYLINDKKQDDSIGMKFVTGNHTANLCPVFAKGPQAKQIHGLMAINELGKILIDLIKN